MVTITLYAKQKKRHRCTEQTFGLCGKRRGWCFERTASKHVYCLGWNRSPAQVGDMRPVLGPGALGMHFLTETPRLGYQQQRLWAHDNRNQKRQLRRHRAGQNRGAPCTKRPHFLAHLLKVLPAVPGQCRNILGAWTPARGTKGVQRRENFELTWVV